MTFEEPTKVARTYYITLTRNQVLSRANGMINASWNILAGNKVTHSGITLASYIKNASNGQAMTGIPYCWGGFNGYDNANSSYKGKSFTNIIGTKYNSSYYFTAGNLNSNNQYIEGSAGVDCSGFAGSAYDFSEKWGTSNFQGSFGHAILRNNLQLMDIMVKNGHCMLYYGRNSNTKGYYVYESTTAGGLNKTVYREVSSSYAEQFDAKTPWCIANSSIYASNATIHWHPCSLDSNCTRKFNSAAHTWINYTTYYRCSVCGKTATTIVEPSGLNLY
ncbi:MAG: hypothetical protein RR398_04460 [Clostridia bacterium]